MTSTAKEFDHLRAIEQAQQSLEFAAVTCGGVELEGNPALIESISESIQSSNALSFLSCSISLSSCFVLCSERSICISTTGSRRQLSIRNNERKGDNDEPDAPLLRDRELAVGEGDVVIGGKESDQANDTSKGDFDKSFSIKPKPPPGRRRIQIPQNLFHPKQPNPDIHQISTCVLHSRLVAASSASSHLPRRSRPARWQRARRWCSTSTRWGMPAISSALSRRWVSWAHQRRVATPCYWWTSAMPRPRRMRWARSRPALCDRSQLDQRGAGLAAAPQLPGGGGRHRALGSRQPRMLLGSPRSGRL